MIKILLAFFLSLFLIEQGQAAYYSPGVFEQVVAIRQSGWTAGPLPEELPPVIGFVARRDCSEIGRLMLIFWENGDLEGPFLIADCANQIEGHDKLMKKKNIIVEIDHNTAKRRQILGYGPEQINVIVVIYVRPDTD